jgi:hypothetical protein
MTTRAAVGWRRTGQAGATGAAISAAATCVAARSVQTDAAGSAVATRRARPTSPAVATATALAAVNGPVRAPGAGATGGS